jgi:hypothetical protein
MFDLKITAESNLRIVNFLGVTFDLNNGKYRPYRKPNDDPLYINRLYSNHPLSIIRQLPTSINKRIALLSSDEQTFMESAPAYQNALDYSNFNHDLNYTLNTHHSKHAEMGNMISFGSTHHLA